MNEKKDFWDTRASLGAKAGTNDLIAKQLEMNAISSYINDCDYVLDFGCGNGLAIANLDKKITANIIGIDFSTKMIEEAKNNTKNCRNKITLIEGDHTILETIDTKFDYIYSERAIINLNSWNEQKDVIIRLVSMLSNNGKYIMCEANQDALDNINYYRKLLSLENIQQPWHNKYLSDEEVYSLNKNGVNVLEENNFSSLYYFLSRVINAAVANDKSIEPDYNSFINQLALKLPTFGNFSQSKIWVLK